MIENTFSPLSIHVITAKSPPNLPGNIPDLKLNFTDEDQLFTQFTGYGNCRIQYLPDPIIAGLSFIPTWLALLLLGW